VFNKFFPIVDTCLSCEDIARLSGDGGRSQNFAPYMGSGRGWLAGD